MNLERIGDIAKREMENKKSSPHNERGDKYSHGVRVAKLAIRLRQHILPNYDKEDDILVVAAWFHDICNGEVTHDLHAIVGSAKVRELLVNECSEEELYQICNIISIHDNRIPETEDYPTIIRIHQDADHIDHFGTMEIFRVIAQTIGHDETIEEALNYFINEWEEQNTYWREVLNFEVSKRIYDDKTNYMKSFIERFRVEGIGEIWDKESILIKY